MSRPSKQGTPVGLRAGGETQEPSTGIYQYRDAELTWRQHALMQVSLHEFYMLLFFVILHTHSLFLRSQDAGSCSTVVTHTSSINSALLRYHFVTLYGFYDTYTTLYLHS